MMSLDELRAVRDTALPDYYDRKANRKLLRIYMNALSNAIEQIEAYREFVGVVRKNDYWPEWCKLKALLTGGNDE
jgi:hypothetical protein